MAMAEPPDEPRWDLLPHDPVRFFALADGFNRNDLKRAYNRLLRRFKPEKAPEEFQRIRAAFEELDENLRYHGGTTGSRTPVPQDWKIDAAPAAEPPAAKPQSTPNKTLIDRISVESPKDLFNELKERADKVPFDYYALALLSDIVEKSPIGFASWLIQGIAAHRQDGALKQLLHEYFRGIQSAPALLKLLPLAARAIRTDEFYPLTEPAWQVVLHDCSFDHFADAFDRCERELRDSHIVGRMAFLIYMLKSAMWLDDSADGWSARQFRFVEENFASIPPWLEWDVELLGLAREYLAIRDQFAAGSPLRTRMDAALKDYFSESQETGDRAVVAAQMEILASGDRLMDDFPIEQNELLAKFYPIWAWASHDVAERQSIDQDKVAINENIWASRAVALLERLEKQCSASPTGWLWSVALMARMVTLALVALVASTLVVTFLLMASNLLGLDKNGATEFFVPVVVVGGIIGLAVATLYWIKPLLDERIWFPLNGRFAATCYRKLWRRELMDFQRRSHVPDQFFRALFAHFAEKSATATWVNEFVQQDYAPALLAGAQRYEA